MKILYIMHVDWAWIKQRPHFFVNELKNKYNLFVIYPFSRHRSVMQKANKKDFKYLSYIRLPGVGIMRGINKTLWKITLSFVIKVFKPEVLWICHPYYGWYIPASFMGKVVYDCMDDHLALEPDPDNKKRIAQFEEYLIQKSDLILYSSLKLKEVLSNRYDLENKKLMLIRNGFDGKILDCKQTIKNDNIIRIGYIGTIAEWFDFDLVLSSLDKFQNIEYHLIGPCREAVSNYSHPRLIKHSTIEHDKLYDAIKDFDCLFMPFIVNDVVESVDPVKLYEYINFDKNIISVYYKEIDRFKSYVHFYSNKTEYNELISNLINGKLKKLYNTQMRYEFLKNNSWHARFDQVEKMLYKL